MHPKRQFHRDDEPMMMMMEMMVMMMSPGDIRCFFKIFISHCTTPKSGLDLRSMVITVFVLRLSQKRFQFKYNALSHWGTLVFC